MSEGRLSNKRFARLTKEIVQSYQDRREFLLSEMMRDGSPPFMVERNPRQVYDQLVAMKNAQDPRFWGDPMAQQELARLEAQFGPAPNVIPEPFPSTYPSEVV